MIPVPCTCRMCEDSRVLAYVNLYGGTYSEARKHAALEVAVRKARVQAANGADPQTRELARDYLRTLAA